jgi:hypothetical protein
MDSGSCIGQGLWKLPNNTRLKQALGVITMDFEVLKVYENECEHCPTPWDCVSQCTAVKVKLEQIGRKNTT